VAARPRGRRLAPGPAYPAILTLLLAMGAAAYGRNKEPEGPPFAYAAGTEDVAAGCRGILALTSTELVFKCLQHPLTIPYAAISLMEYRPEVSTKILRMDLKWKVPLPVEHGRKSKRNRYFSVVFEQAGIQHLAVLEVEPQAMVSYLAEIELKTGKRVEVWGYAD
jgi:hypothetical protein